jgi:serine/threonine protein kinase
VLTPENACLCCFKELNEPKGVCPYCGCDNSTVANESHQIECGSILAGTYLIGKVLGQGGFGITYVAWDLNLDIKVAIKEYYPEGCVTRDTHTHITVLTYAGAKDVFFQKGKERFVGEARALAKFSGDTGVVGVRAFFYENGTAYIVMDFVEGETLKSYAARAGGKLPSAQVLSLFYPLIRSLAHVHENGLLHRDISPDNIMLRPDGTLALLDFGAARQISVMGEHSNTINVKHGYAPEEQYRTRGEQGPWTDVYALCATIYRLTAGVTPTEALDRMANDEALAPPSAYGADFTPEQESALMRGLALRAAARTQDLRALAQELYGASAPAPSGSIPNARATAHPQSMSQPQTAERVSAAADAQPVVVHSGTTGQEPSVQPRSDNLAEQFQYAAGANTPGNDVAPHDKKSKQFTILAAVSLLICLTLIVIAAIPQNAPTEAYYDSNTATQAPVESVIVATPDPSIVVLWQDPILEAGIREALGKTNGEDITTGDLAYITKLDIAGDTVVVNDDSYWPYVDTYSNMYSVDGGVTMLPITDQTISLNDLQWFYGLQTLNIVATSVNNCEALASCMALNTLLLDACGDIDLNWFSGMQNLIYLNIADCRNIVLQGAQGISLDSLSLSNCGTLSGSELAEYSRIKSLSLWMCPLEASEELGKMINLTGISLGDTGISNVDFLSNLTNLEWLSLSESGVKSVPSLEQARNLTGVFFSYCGLDDADMRLVAYNPNMNAFSMNGCNVSDLTFLSSLTNMDHLSFISTSIKDLSPISNLTRLTSLWMCDTKITDISVLSNFRNLRTLAIAGAKIKDYSPLAGLNLTTLYVDSSQEQKIRQMFPNAEIYIW